MAAAPTDDPAPYSDEAPDVRPDHRSGPDARQPTFLEILRGSSPESWNLNIKLWEILIAIAILFGTLFIGITANGILKSQIETSERLGRQQNQAAILQAYVASVSNSGFEDENRRRMLHMSLDLYGMLVQEDRRFTTLYTSMPSITQSQLEELVETREDPDDIRQLFARRNDVAQALRSQPPVPLVRTGPYHIVIGTFRRPDYARNALVAARQTLQATDFRPYFNIVQNEDGLFLVTISGFASRDEALRAMQRERLHTRFSSIYAAQSRGWRAACSAHFEPCDPAPAPAGGAGAPRR